MQYSICSIYCCRYLAMYISCCVYCVMFSSFHFSKWYWYCCCIFFNFCFCFYFLLFFFFIFNSFFVHSQFSSFLVCHSLLFLLVIFSFSLFFLFCFLFNSISTLWEVFKYLQIVRSHWRTYITCQIRMIYFVFVFKCGFLPLRRWCEIILLRRNRTKQRKQLLLTFIDRIILPINCMAVSVPCILYCIVLYCSW